MKVKSIGLLLMLLVINAYECVCQSNNNLPKAREIIREKPAILSNAGYRFIGFVKNDISILVVNTVAEGSFYNYDRTRGQVYRDNEYTIDSKSKVVDCYRADDVVIFHGLESVPPSIIELDVTELPVDNYSYQDLWMHAGDKLIQIDRLPDHFIDRNYSLQISVDKRFAMLNPYTTASPEYNPDNQDYFVVYDLNAYKNGFPRKQTVKCSRCLAVNKVGHNYIFEQELAIGKGFDGHYSNIYYAHETNITDTVLIAAQANLVSVSADGKSIIASKTFHGKQVLVYIDMPTKQFQYLLGRDYSSMKIIFFANGIVGFEDAEKLIFVDKPREFLFDATVRESKVYSKADNDKFWSSLRLSD
jgi:hypothetical protein